MKILLLTTILTLFACEDQIIEPKTEIVTTPALCSPTDPESEPSLYRFDGAESISKITKNSAEIKWTHVEGFHSYNIISVNSRDRKVLKTVSAPVEKAILKNLTPNSNYKIIVRGLDKRGHVETNTNHVEFKTLPWANFNNQRSLSFNGSQSLSFAPSNEMIKTNNASISVWIKRDKQYKEEHNIFTLHKSNLNDANAQTALSIGVRRQFLKVTYTDDTGILSEQTKSFDFTDNSWHQITVSIQTNKFSVYIDAKKFININKSISSFGNREFYTGSFIGTKNGFIGLIDELAFFDIALSPNQIRELYNNSRAPDLKSITFSNSLYHWYQFGDNPADNSANIEDNVGIKNAKTLNIDSSDFQIDAP